MPCHPLRPEAVPSRAELRFRAMPRYADVYNAELAAAATRRAMPRHFDTL